MKRTAIKRRPLADTVLASLEPEAKEYREAYGVDRLYFVVSPSGRKRWEVRYKNPETGRWGWMGVGGYPDKSARLARDSAKAIADDVSNGIDPLEKRRQEKASHRPDRMANWSVTAEEWYSHCESEGIAHNTLRGIRSWLDNDAYPTIGRIPISKVTRADCVRVQQRLEDRNALSRAIKARGWLNGIFRYAVALGRCDSNPAADLTSVAKRAPESTPYAHLLESELPGFLRAMNGSPSGLLVKTAARINVLTASRPGNVRWMHWDEVNLDKALWHIPAGKMKARRDHLVPLPKQAIDGLRQVRPLATRSGYVFPGRGSKSPVVSHSAINNCIDLAGYQGRMTGHGARHTATTLLTEHGWPERWTDMQLSHKKVGVRGVYDKAAYLEKRKLMMQWYADYLDALERGITEEEVEDFQSRIRLM
ncbi:Putative prophage CPS-53 integrase [Halomonas sp. THAF12]|uniref:tyrosine-type recombinase/integrase n=1 Tax=Halomonas sp. THAF12 TaxID=2587849 RepID=UPI001267BC6E|nr:tyrosine-type recombinase/integrase [Halomonas sp. THAF12]QFT84997.1 Putative prophage CPS-53 integrase [Halomonas sp. THAF12]